MSTWPKPGQELPILETECAHYTGPWTLRAVAVDTSKYLCNEALGSRNPLVKASGCLGEVDTSLRRPLALKALALHSTGRARWIYGEPQWEPQWARTELDNCSISWVRRTCRMLVTLAFVYNPNHGPLAWTPTLDPNTCKLCTVYKRGACGEGRAETWKDPVAIGIR